MSNNLRIFISYSRKDTYFVDRLDADLIANSYSTWVDRQRLEGGAKWISSIQEAINACDVMILVLSPDSIVSDYVSSEWLYAKQRGKILIPIVYRSGIEVPFLLNTIQWISEFETNYIEGLEKLLSRLSVLSRQISTTIDYQSEMQITPIKISPKVPPTSHNRSTSVNFSSIAGLKVSGFDGFISIRDLIKTNCASVPAQKGNYIVVRDSITRGDFLSKGTGGFFKGKDPNVPIEELISHWVEKAIVLYIGQTGSGTSDATLRSRIKQLVAYGSGKPVGHSGGSYLWQLQGSPELLVGWKPATDQEPNTLKSELIDSFQQQYGKRPFANRTG